MLIASPGAGARAAGRIGLALLATLSLVGAARAQPVPAPPGPSAREQVAVSAFRVTGSTAFSPEELRALLAEGEGRRLSLSEIEALANRITAFYRQHGYILARAYVPPQEVREGVVEIAVLEGRVGRIEVKGARWYDADYLRSYLAPPPRTAAFHAGRHERGLLLLNELPGLEVKSTLAPGAEPGTTDIVLDVEKDRLLTGGIDANNYGSSVTGRERFGLALNLNNPLGLGDGLSFRGLTSRHGGRLWYARLSYGAPLNTWGSRVGVAYTHIAVAADVGTQIGDVDVRAAGDVGSLFVSHQFIRSRDLTVYGQVGFDYKDLTSSLQSQDQGGLTRHDRLRVFTAGLGGTSIDRWRGANSVSLTLHQGVGRFIGGLKGDDDPDASRPGAGGSFTKMTGEGSRLQQLTGSTSIFFKAGGQWASTGLTSPEQFIVGGVGTVRGYPVAEVAGDHGYAVTAEFRWNAPGFFDAPAFLGKKWGEILQVFLFADHGGAVLLDPLPGEGRTRLLTGAGVGLQVGIHDNFLLRVEFAKPVTRPINGPRPSDGLDNVIYFLAAKWF